MPENAKSTDEEEAAGNENEMEEIYKALDVNLEEPLKADEKVEVPHAYIQPRPRVLDLFGYSQTRATMAADSLQSYNGPALLEQNEKKKKKVRKTGHKGPREKRESRKKELNGSNTYQSNSLYDAKWLNSVEANETATKALKKTSKSSMRATSGICTPSNPNLHFGSSSSNGALTPHEDSSSHHAKERVTKLRLSSYKVLGETEDLKLTYETRVSTDDANQIAIGIVFSNKGQSTLRNLEMNVLDTINTRLLREEGKSSMAGIPLSFQLPAGVSAEHVFRFSVKAINMPQKLRGNLTFFTDVTQERNYSRQTRFPYSDADGILSCACHNYKFERYELQIIGTTNYRSSMELMVKKNDIVAALYAHTIKAESICILIKQQGDKIQIDGRCGDQQLIYSVVDELRDIISS
ncbi:AP-3 complex subunit delta [Dirofilaria immitis]|nr:AP-3 complex subunit delta [Dirofilaria immitis]